MTTPDPEGHVSGHAADAPPVGLTWALYVEQLVQTHGGMTALADELIRRAQQSSEVPEDPQSVEKGLRRLARREHRPGGQYGRWLLRCFGVPSRVEDFARWLAQYHSRFADLPTSVRLAQLRLWDRPPVSESRAAAWVHVGLASVAHRLADLSGCRERLAMAINAAERTGSPALVEAKLLAARLATDDGKRVDAARFLEEASAALATTAHSRADQLCYRARIIQQRGYHLTKPLAGQAADVRGALALFQSIEEDAALPFVAFRKCAGLAYCTWQLGDAGEGARLARLAATHAGDGGFVRFRIMALNLLTRMVQPAEARELNLRAERLARQLEDEDLLQRVTRLSGT